MHRVSQLLMNGCQFNVQSMYKHIENYHLFPSVQSYYKIMLRYVILQHQWIQEFPSQWFYGGKLMPAKLVQDRENNPNMKDFWPSVNGIPLVFCDIVGKEEGQQASGTRKKHIAMESKSNPDEAKKAVGIVCNYFIVIYYTSNRLK